MKKPLTKNRERFFLLTPEAGEPAEDLIGVAFARQLQNPEHKIKRIGHGLHLFPLRMRYYSAAQRYRNVTACTRVQGSSGANRTVLTPLVIPFFTAHTTGAP